MGWQIRDGKKETPQHTLTRDEWIGFWTAIVVYPEGHSDTIVENHPGHRGDMSWKDLETHLDETGGRIHQLILEHDGRKYYTIPGLRGYRCYMNLRSDTKFRVSGKGVETTPGKTRLYRGMEFVVDLVHGGQSQPMTIILWVDGHGNMHQEIKLSKT